MKLASRLEAVTVYARGAVCERVAEVPAGQGPRLVIGGLPMSLRPASVRARVRGESAISVLEVRPGFSVALQDPIDVSAERKALEAAEGELARLQLQAARLQKEIDDVSSLAPSYGPRRKGEAPREAPVEATLELARFVGDALPSLQAEKRLLDDKLTDANNEAQLRQRRLAEASSERTRGPVQIERTAEVALSAVPTSPVSLVIEYLVPGARWVPTYELQLGPGMSGGLLSMRAAVAQCSGEDWVGVRLALSTADLDRRIEKLTLRSLRIGRSQPPPPRSGWREPPPGLDALFADFDVLNALRPAKAQAPSKPKPKKAPKGGAALPAPASTPSFQVAPELARRAAGSSSTPHPPPAPPMAQAAPVMLGAAAMAVPRNRPPAPKSSSGIFRSRGSRDGAPADMMDMDEEMAPDASAEGYGGGPGGGGVAAAIAEPPAPELTVDETLLDYDLMRMAQPTEAHRGRLQPGSLVEVQAIAVHVQLDVLMAVISTSEQIAGSVDHLSLPAHARPPRDTAGSFDYRYTCNTPADVPSIAAWKVLPVATADVAITAEYQCVPSVEPKVYRTVSLKNRSEHALLPGPVDVFVGGGFLLTAQLPTLAPSGDAETLGLGVEEAIKVARNTAFKETTGGLLGGSTVLPHEIAIDVENRTAGPATIEVRERIPVSTDEDVKIEELRVEPAWKKDEALRDGRITRGARSWKVTLAPGEKKSLSAEFSVKIPSSKMLHGGNRRV